MLLFSTCLALISKCTVVMWKHIPSPSPTANLFFFSFFFSHCTCYGGKDMTHASFVLIPAVCNY